MSRLNGVSEDCSAEVVMQGNNLQRTGTFLCERALKPGLINADTFGRLSTVNVDGHVYAQILYLPRRHFDLARDVAFVATMRNTLYAIDVSDAHNPKVIWQKTVGPHVPVQEVYGWDYRDIYEALGILATPIIDQSTNRIYFTSQQLINGKVSLHMYALSIFDGTEELHTVVEGGVKGNGAGNKDGWMEFNPYFHLQRPGLAMVNNYIVIAMGSLADLRPFHGWVFAFRKDTLARAGVFCATPNSEGGGIWQSAGGLVVQVTTNRVLVVTGNGYGSDPEKGEYVQSLLSLDVGEHGINVADWGAPSSWFRWSEDDADMCTPCSLIPGTDRCILGSKDAHMYMFRTPWLGNVKKAPNEDQQMQIIDCSEEEGGAEAEDPSSRSNIHGSPIVWHPEGKDRRIYVGPEHSHLQVYEFKNFQEGNLGSGEIDPKPILKSEMAAEPKSMPGWILSVAADQRKDGIVVASMVRPGGGNANGFITAGIIRLFDALSMKELWNSEMREEDDVLDFAKFNQVTVADGMMFVPTFGDRATQKPGAFHILGYRDRQVDPAPYTPPPPSPPPVDEFASSGAGEPGQDGLELTSSGSDSVPVDGDEGAGTDPDLDLPAGVMQNNTATFASQPMGLPVMLLMWIMLIMLVRRWTH